MEPDEHDPIHGFDMPMAVSEFPIHEVSPEQIAAMKRSLRRKLIVGILIGALGAGASALSCVGQSFSYRQAKALEAISKQLAEGCKR